MVELIKKDEKHSFGVEHAQNILNHPINSMVKDPWKLPKDSVYTMKDGELKKKSKSKG